MWRSISQDYPSVTSKALRFALIPDPFSSDCDAQRFEHRDLASRTPQELWAEKEIINLRLARLIASGDRPRLIFCINGAAVSDQAWLEERSRRLQVELRRRKRAA